MQNKALEYYKVAKASFPSNFYSDSFNLSQKAVVSKALLLNYKLSKLDNCIWEEKKRRGREKVEQRNAIELTYRPF